MKTIWSSLCPDLFVTAGLDASCPQVPQLRMWRSPPVFRGCSDQPPRVIPPPSAPPTSCPLGGTELGSGWSHHGIYGPRLSTQLWGIQHSRLDNSPLSLPNARISSPFCHWEIQGPFPRLRPFKTIACLREFHPFPSSFLPC